VSSRFEGRTVLITGAAGDIGQAAALRFAGEGASVAVFDRRQDLLSGTVEQCEALGAKVLALAVDQTKPEAIEQGVAEVTENLGVPAVLFANAGYGKFAKLLDQPATDWDRHVAVNLTGTFLLVQAVARRMVEGRAGGSIVINTSSGAVQYSDLLGAYCVTKAGLRMLTIGLASELGNYRIRVNAVMPGVIETGMTGPMLTGPNGMAHRAGLLSDTPVGRLGGPEDVANAVAFLASDEAAFITGDCILVDGGQTIHGHPRWYRSDYRAEMDADWQVVQ